MVINALSEKIQETFCKFYLALLLIPSLIWIFSDCHVWPWDQAWYGEVTTGLWIVLARHPAQWLSGLLSAFGAKPPAIAWLGEFFVPLGIYFHHLEPALLLSILLMQWLTLILIYKIGKELCPSSYILPFTGCLFAASMPLFIAMSHQYFVEPIQTLAVTYFYWIALKSAHWSNVRTLGHSLNAGFLGLLAKFSTPLYCILPVSIIIWQMTKRISKKSLPVDKSLFTDWLLIISGFLLGILTIAWYQINFVAMWTHAKESSVGTVALDFGHKDIFINKFVLWSQALFVNFFIPEIGWLFAILVLGGFAILILQNRIKLFSLSLLSLLKSQNNLIGISAFLQIFLVLAIFSTTINEENRYLMSLIPSITVVVLLLAQSLNNRLINYLICGLAAVQFIMIHAEAHALIAKDQRICSWLTPSCTDKTQEKEIDRLINLTSNNYTANQYNICGVELPWLNANSLSFYAVKHELKTHKRAYYTSLGYAEKDEKKALQRLKDIHPIYFISIDESKSKIPNDVFNRVSDSILQDLYLNKDWNRVYFQSDTGIIILHNTKN